MRAVAARTSSEERCVLCGGSASGYAGGRVQPGADTRRTGYPLAYRPPGVPLTKTACVMTIDDTILWLESKGTGRRFPVARFSADTDMPTVSLVSLTSITRQEIVVAQLTAGECNAGELLRYQQMQSRINAALHRDDLRAVWLVCAEERKPYTPGLSFQEFRRIYRSPCLLYRDIFEEDSLAEQVFEVSRRDFESGGGQILRYEG